jgi:hypothetical protein
METRSKVSLRSLLLATVAAVLSWAGAAAQAPVSSAIGSAATPAPAAAAPALPPGVREVLFGPPYQHPSSTGIPYCRIKNPLPAPRFAAGVREIAWTAMVDREVVTDLVGRVSGDAGGELAVETCNAFGTCSRGMCRVQWGAVLHRKDGQPLQPGTYHLEIEVAGQKADLPFEIAAPATAAGQPPATAAGQPGGTP